MGPGWGGGGTSLCWETVRAVQMGAFLRVGILDMGVDSVIFLLEFLTISPHFVALFQPFK